MNRSIRQVGGALGLAFLALFVTLNWVHIVESRDLSEHERNRRLLLAEHGIERGRILAGDTVIAESVPVEGPLRFLRRYPEGELFGQITGYYSVRYGFTGLERTFNATLTGADPAGARNLLDEMLGGERKGHDLILTLDPDLQGIARDALDGQVGGVAVVDAETGAVLALYGHPSYDPTAISSHAAAESDAAWRAVTTDPARPLIARPSNEIYPPGSTFKIVAAAAGLELGGMTPGTSFPNPHRLSLPGTDQVLRNFGDRACPGGGATITLAAGFRVSCNSTFAQIAMRIGPEPYLEMGRRFGLDRRVGFDIPLARSCTWAVRGECQDPDTAPAFLAYSAIGQQNVRITPLQMALISAAVANGGYLVRPRLVEEARSFAGLTVARFPPAREGPIFSEETAAAIQDMMIGTVRTGTGAVVGFTKPGIGGKTGTAEIGDGSPPHVWFTAWGDGIAVAVIVEHGGRAARDATGGRVAGPIAKAVLEAAMDKRA